MIRAHVRAVLDALRADPRLTVYDVDMPGIPELPYVVVFPTLGNRTAERLDGESDRADHDFYINLVGSTSEQIQLIGEWVYEAVVDKRLVIPGRNTWKIKVLTAQAIRPDQDVQPPVLVCPVLCRLSSVPGAAA